MVLFLGQFQDNPIAVIPFIAAFGLALMAGIAFHEFSHAWTAFELGDSTAARQGRLTLNPIRHLDPVGTVLLLLVGLGWGRPTPVNPYNLRGGARLGNALVAAAGPISNFVFATIAALPLRLGIVDSVATIDGIGSATGEEIIGLFLVFFVWLNVLLGVFNLIPIHPLDGFKVLVGVLPAPLGNRVAALAPWGPGILMVLFVMAFITPYNPLGWAIGSMGQFVLDIIA
ncbi:MAG: site-2 protease family protein [Dehalococcoidia bacterium]